jgi:putative Mg2+ transporter-C (MgtC) family protein
MASHVVLCLRLLLAAVLGGAVGLERELAGKPAGLRTNLLIAMGAALFTHVSFAIPAATGVGDPARVAAQVVAGVGFLGAGTIIHARHAVHGLTSAATVWVVAGLGVAAGAGAEHDAVLATLAVLVALTTLRAVEHRFLGRETLSLTLAFTGEPPDAMALVSGLNRHLSRVERKTRPDGSGVLGISWRGKAADVARVTAAAQALPGVRVEGWEVEP